MNPPPHARRLVLGTKNRKKLAEMQGLLAGIGFEVVSIDEVCPDLESPEETGETFEDNAKLKALYFANACGAICVADDSGLEVDALDGAPGVYSARWGGEDGDDEANNRKLIESLDGVAEEERGAQYRCVIAVATPGHIQLVLDGSCRGSIVETAAGDGGFGYDPHFFYPDFNQTFAQVSAAKKAEVSHRGQAMARLKNELPSLMSVIDGLGDR